MKEFKYVIVGGGMAADAAVGGIRERDQEGTIAVLSSEKNPPYNRPPLSKKLWTGKPMESIWRSKATSESQLFLETTVIGGDASARTITDSKGNAYRYKNLLLATGGTPRKLPMAPEGVIYFRTVDDYLVLRELADGKSSFIVIGGGFIGSEIAAALAMNGCKVTMVFPEDGICARIFPPALAGFLVDYYREKNVNVLAGEHINELNRSGNRFTVATKSGKHASADAVVAGLGIEPNVDLARTLGLKIENGIVVDEQLRAAPNVFAAGDVANFYSDALGMRRRVEHEDNTNTMGSMAGRNMAGASEKYEYLPYFYSDLFDLGYEAVGQFGVEMTIVEDWKEKFRKGVIYYLKDDRVRGVLLWNTWDQIGAARELITSKSKIDPKTLTGRIHD